MLTSEQFDRTRRLALRLAGIELLDRHRELLPRRCRRIGILSAATLDALLSAAEDGDPTASRKFVGPGHYEVHRVLSSSLAFRGRRPARG